MNSLLILCLLMVVYSSICMESKSANKVVGRLRERKLSGRSRRATNNLLQSIILNEDLKQGFIDEHNLCRKKVNPPASDMREITWDETLEKMATDYAKKCKYPDHRPESERKTSLFSVVGENMAKSGGSFTNGPSSVTTAWFNEVVDYNFHDGSCAEGKECGHYIQVVWNETYKIGCGISRCKNLLGGYTGNLYVCNYGPAGNKQYYNTNSRHIPPYTVGSAGSGCSGEFPHNNDGLCSKTAVKGQSSITSAAPTKATTAITERSTDFENALNHSATTSFGSSQPGDRQSNAGSSNQNIVLADRMVTALSLMVFAILFFVYSVV